MMSDSHSWRRYAAAGDGSHRIEAYLHRKIWTTEVEVSLPSLLHDIEVAKVPTCEWYALHYAVEDCDKWGHDLMAWGLNIAGSDLSKIRREVADIFATQAATESHETYLPVPDLSTIGSRGMAYVFDEAIEKFEALYSRTERKFATVRVPRYWRESVLQAFALNCSASARRKVELPHRPKCTSSVSSLTPKPPGDASNLNVSLNFDCVDRIFSMSGLKLGTMRALARVWGFNAAEIETLVKRRCNPTPLLAELVVDPGRFRDMMHECDVVLTGSRAAGFFWPSARLADSEWRITTHPHVSYWLKFAAYLISIGTEFEFPAPNEKPRTARVVDAADAFPDERYHHSEVRVLHGSLRHKGRRHRLQLTAHPEHPMQQSSIQDVLKLHSSIAQCLITGFGAVCMYAQQTTTGKSHAWRVGDCHDSALRVSAQRQVDRYVKRGITYTPPRSHVTLDPTQTPEPKLRKLGDAGALCVSFERYVSGEKAAMVRSDFDLLREVAWWEECQGLKTVRQAGGSFWGLNLEDSFADRAISRAVQRLRVPLFDSMMDRLQCKRCQVNAEALCSAHAFDNDAKSSSQLLFFCLRHVERRRTGWSFLGLDFHWDECWEYPFI